MEEFNGPFSSWANIKTRFGAVGDGQHDDTKAIQQGLDSLSDWLQNFNKGKAGYTVVYLPRGTYKLTATLVLRGKMGVRIVGEDPVNTILLWQGNEKDTMFWANGSAYFSISRLSWDPGGRKNMEAIGMHWKSQWQQPGNRSYAPEETEFTDHIFRKGFETGIGGGTLGAGSGTGINESEVTIKRCVFNECTGNGISITGFNALDYWIWYCSFIKCKVGVTSNSGNYHIYKSYFTGSVMSDVFNKNSNYTSVRYCYSENSSMFSWDDGGSSNPFKRIFEGNVAKGISNLGILYTHTGKLTLLDNIFQAAPVIAQKKFLDYGSWAPSNFELMDINNRIEGFDRPFVLRTPNRIFTRKPVQLQAASKPAGSSFVKSLPPVPPYKARTVFDVPLNAGAKQIQDIINQASALRKRAVIHFPYGSFHIDRPLVIPVNSDIQLTGDGHLYASVLLTDASGKFENGAAIKIMCPTATSITNLDLQLTSSGYNEGRAIALLNADQPGATVILDQFYSGSDTSLTINGYDHTLFQKTNSFFTEGTFISGGKLMQQGKGTASLQCFGAQFAKLTVDKNAFFTARDCWWEGLTDVPLNLKGSGTIAIQGAMIAAGKADSSVIISINDFAGKITLSDMYMIGSLAVKANNPSLQLLAWNLNIFRKKRPLAFLNNRENYKAFYGGITTQCADARDRTCGDFLTTEDRSVNIDNVETFMDLMTRPLRDARPVEYTAKAAGVTNFYLSRVSVSAHYRTGISFTK